MNRGRTAPAAMALLVACILSLCACRGEPHAYDGYYYGGWDGGPRWNDGWAHRHWHHGGWRHGFVSHANWQRDRGHGFAGHGGFGWHRGGGRSFAGHGGFGGHGGGRHG